VPNLTSDGRAGIVIGSPFGAAESGGTVAGKPVVVIGGPMGSPTGMVGSGGVEAIDTGSAYVFYPNGAP
jgi:hypothetical protein